MSLCCFRGPFSIGLTTSQFPVTLSTAVQKIRAERWKCAYTFLHLVPGAEIKHQSREHARGEPTAESVGTDRPCGGIAWVSSFCSVLGPVRREEKKLYCGQFPPYVGGVCACVCGSAGGWGWSGERGLLQAELSVQGFNTQTHKHARRHTLIDWRFYMRTKGNGNTHKHALLAPPWSWNKLYCSPLRTLTNSRE